MVFHSLPIKTHKTNHLNQESRRRALILELKFMPVVQKHRLFGIREHSVVAPNLFSGHDLRGLGEPPSGSYDDEKVEPFGGLEISILLIFHPVQR